MPYEVIQLTDDQKKVALDNWDKMDIANLTKLVFNDQTLDGRSTEGMSTKAFLADENIKVKTTHFVPSKPIELTEDQKRKIEELAPTIESTLELARLVFPSTPPIKHLSREWRAVYAYHCTVAPDGITANDAPTTERDYTPPPTLQVLVGQVNDLVPTGDITKRLYIWGKLKISEERQLKALMANLRIMRFKYQASQYQRDIDRKLYISTFVRFTHDKPDLTQEEVDQYISAAVETVNITQIERNLQQIDKVMEEMMQADPETRRMSMTMVEYINATRSKLDQAKGRLKTLIEGLVGTRNKRLQDKDQRNSSILNLFEAFQKDKQKRDDLYDLVIKEKDEDVREVGRIRDLDDVVAIICGQTEAEGGA